MMVGGATAEVVEQVVDGALAAILIHLAGSCITDSECLHVHPYSVASLMADTGTHQGVSCRRGTHCRTCARDALPAVLRFSPASKWGPVRAVYHQSLLYRHQHSTTHKTQTTLQRKISPSFQMLNTIPLGCTLCFCLCIDSVHSSPGSDSHFLDPLVLEASSASDCD